MEIAEEGRFRWCNASVLLLLSLYRKLKVQFRDPKITKRKLWKFIEQKFIKKNYIVNADMLDKKFRNLKQTYLRVQQKRQSGKGRVTWEYLELFDSIYADDESTKPIIKHRTPSPLPSCSINPDSTIWLNNLESNETLLEENSQSVKLQEYGMENCQEFCMSTNIETELLNIEKLKVQKLSEIADSMKERNEILKKLLNNLQNNSSK